MSKKQPSDKRRIMAKPVRRREALKGIGAFAISAPTLAAIGCSSEPPNNMAGNPITSPGASGVGAPPANPGVAGMTSAAAGSSSTATGSAGVGIPSSGVAGSKPPAPAAAGISGGTNPSASSAGTGAAAGRGPSAGTSSAGTGAAAGSGGGNAAMGGSGSAMAGTGGSMTPSDFIPVMFADAGSCALTPTDPAGEGPFFIHEDEVMNDDSLRRVDMRGGKPGVELQLNLRVLDMDGKCMTPISGVDVYVWHTDALGLYSGFANQNPDQTYTGGIERTVENMDRFCRGIQTTDKDGIVRFRTVYPGWYNGRAIHIHFVALRPGSGPMTMSYRSAQYMVFTTQMYFAEQFSRMIHENNAPYMQRLTGGYNTYVKPQNTTVNPTMKMEGKIAVGALNIVTSGKGSRR